MGVRRVFGTGRELSAGERVIPARCGVALPPGIPGVRGRETSNRFSSRSRPALPAEIPGGFSSSSLPPSFPRGRSATLVQGPAAPSGRRRQALPASGASRTDPGRLAP